MTVPIGIESWIWYGFAMLAVTLRFISRYLHVESLKHLQLEDYLMALAACVYTIIIVLLNVVADVETNLIAPGDLPNLTPESIRARIRGSKMVLGLESSMCCVIWLCKSCILLLYYRLTFGLRQQLLVKGTGVYVVVSFVVMMTLYFAVWCRPFSAYWQTPSNNVQCTTATHHLITNFIFNVTSDLLILSIPLPLLLRSSSLPIAKKLALTLLFSLGLFVMACAVASKYYSFKQPFSPIWIFWYTREASTAMVITNMAHIWSGARRIFHLRSFTGSEERSEARRRGDLYSPESSAQEQEGMEQAASRRLSVPYADLGGLLPPGSPMRKTYRSSSVGRIQHQRKLSSVPLAPSPSHSKRSSWIGSLSEQTANTGFFQSADGYLAATSQVQGRTASLVPTVDPMVRNPASARMSLPRGLQRADSITLLGLPDSTVRAASVSSAGGAVEAPDLEQEASSRHSRPGG